MSSFFKKFGRKKKQQSKQPPPLNIDGNGDRGGSLFHITKEVNHGFVDSIGGLTFPTSPSKRNAISAPSSTSRPKTISNKPAEFTILWSRPSFRRQIKVNPIFINEPTEFYEGALIPPDNAHDFDALPRYRTSLYDEDVTLVRDSSTDTLYRSRSLGAIPTYSKQNQGMNLAEVKKRRKDESVENHSERMFGLFQSPENLADDGDDTLSFSSFLLPNEDRNRDSGVHLEDDMERKHEEEGVNDNNDDDEQLNLTASADSGTFSYDDQLEDTILESSLIISALENSKLESTSPSQISSENENETNESRNGSGGEDINKSRRTSSGLYERSRTSRFSMNGQSEESPTAMFFIVQTSFSGASPTYGDDDDESKTSDSRINRRERAMSEDNQGASVANAGAEHGRQQSHMDIRLKQTSSSTSSGEGLRVNDRFAKSPSPTLAAVPRGRVSSIKYSFEGTARKSKSVSNLSSTNHTAGDGFSDDDDDAFEKRRPTLKSAASFGHINTNSLSPLLNDRRFFQKAISSNKSNNQLEDEDEDEDLPSASVAKTGLSSSSRTGLGSNSTTTTAEDNHSPRERLGTGERRTKVDILTNNNETYRVIRQVEDSDSEDEAKAAIVRQRLGIDDATAMPRVAWTPSLTLSDLNLQARSGTPSEYRHAEGTHNILTGAGLTILNTTRGRSGSNGSVEREKTKKPTVDSLLRNMGRSVLPDLVDGKVSRY